MVDGIPLHLEIIASLRGTRWLFALGFFFDGESFGAAIGKISGKKLADGGFMDNVGVDVAVSYIPWVLESQKKEIKEERKTQERST